MTNTEQTIFELLQRHGPIRDFGRIHEYRFFDNGLINSINLMAFIIDVEERFDIELTPEDTQSEEFRSVGGLVQLIEKKLPHDAD